MAIDGISMAMGTAPPLLSTCGSLSTSTGCSSVDLAVLSSRCDTRSWPVPHSQGAPCCLIFGAPCIITASSLPCASIFCAAIATDDFARALLQHCYNEFTFLSRLLPSLVIAENRNTHAVKVPW
jgi:hypothetical protein